MTTEDGIEFQDLWKWMDEYTYLSAQAEAKRELS